MRGAFCSSCGHLLRFTDKQTYHFNLDSCNWIIIGGESGPHHRPMQIEWARNLVRQAKDQGVAVWMKQLGGLRPGGDLEDFPEDLRIREFPVEALK